MSYLFAVLAAISNAVSNTLQRKADREEPPEVAMRLQLMLNLVRRPVWLAGFVTVLISFLLEAAALHGGQLAAVQPILVLELPITLVVSSRVFHSRLHAREWVSIAVMSAGLGGFILFLSPSLGNGGRSSMLDWAIGIAATLGAAAGCLFASFQGSGPRRAALLGLGSGIMFGLTAAFMKGAVGGHQSLLSIMTVWQTYAMLIAGLAAFFLMQNALQAGRLLASQPGITLADPAVAVLWGVFVFDEHTRSGLYLVGAAASGIAMAIGTVVLSRSSLLESEEGKGDRAKAHND